jgi:hypothetical protein
MPYSDPEGKRIILDTLAQTSIGSVLDIGAGSGTYARLIRDDPRFAGSRRPTLTGIEVWAPYVARFGLAELYDSLIVGDVREIDPLPGAEAVILGDVAEHMTAVEAALVWDRARAAAWRTVILSLPIVHYPQGAAEGNPYERHITDNWSHEEVLARFPGIVWSWRGNTIGVYGAAGRPVRSCRP